MRIIFSDWVIALDKGRLPRQYDDGEPLEVVNAPDGWAWTLNAQMGGNLDVIPLSVSDGVVGTTLSKSQLALAGDYLLQLIGTKDGVTRHTNIISMAVPKSLSGDATWPTLPTAFSDALDRAEDAADRAESAATHGPRISGTNTWEVWDPDKGQYVDTMVDASGKTGPQGPAGVDGTTPDIKIGTVTTLEPGEDATVSIRGTVAEPVLDWGIPKGAKGAAGAEGTLVLDYIHDEEDLLKIYPTAYDATSGIWTTDGQVDLTTLAAVGEEAPGFYQLNIIDPIFLLSQDFDKSKWAGYKIFKLKILSENTFSGLTPSVVPEDLSKYIVIKNVAVVLDLPTGLSNRLRFEFEGQFKGVSRYSTFGMPEWFDPNGRTTIANEIGYNHNYAIYNHIISDFELAGGYIKGHTKQIFVSTSRVGSGQGEYYPFAAESWPTKIYLSRYAHVGYESMPYKGRLRIYDIGSKG